MNEEARRRKIIADSYVTIVAGNGIAAVMAGSLTDDQLTRLTALDDKYLAAVKEVAPELMPPGV